MSGDGKSTPKPATPAIASTTSMPEVQAFGGGLAPEVRQQLAAAGLLSVMPPANSFHSVTAPILQNPGQVEQYLKKMNVKPTKDTGGSKGGSSGGPTGSTGGGNFGTGTAPQGGMLSNPWAGMLTGRDR